MPTRSRTTIVQTNQSSVDRLVTHRTAPESLFLDGLRRLARSLLFSVLDLSEQERQLLHDLARDEVRVQLRIARRLNAIAARSVRPADREGLPELFRLDLNAQTPFRPTSIRAAFDAETEAEGPANIAQRMLERCISPATIDAADQALTCQLVTTRDAVDATRALRLTT